MAELRKAQVLLEPEEYEHLEQVATRRGISVPELIRMTVRERYMTPSQDRKKAAEEICRMELPIHWGDWETIEREIEEAHDIGFP
jgi:hypothetical protein